jgi:hypothetical protein
MNYHQSSASIVVVLGFPNATSSLTVVTPDLSFQVGKAFSAEPNRYSADPKRSDEIKGN